MLLFTQGEEKSIVLTLNEKATLNEPYYLLVFTQITTKETLSIIFFSGDDASEYPQRYNQFTMPADFFTDKTPGQWQYVAYEQESSTNTDVEQTAGVVEYGKAQLSKASAFEFPSYQPETSYTVYAG